MTTMTLHKWVTYRAEELRAAGVIEKGEKPDELRLATTGHKLPLSPIWARTVGYWCVADTADFLGREETEKLPAKPGILGAVDRTSFDMFKYRHKLRTGKQFRGEIGAEPWRLAQECYDIYAIRSRQHRGEMPMGKIFAELGPKVIGLLPVEGILWATAFKTMLEVNGLVRRSEDPEQPSWENKSPKERTGTWLEGDEKGDPWDVRQIFTNKAWCPWAP